MRSPAFDVQKTMRRELALSLKLRGRSFRDVRREVMKQLDLKSYSISTAVSDVRAALKEQVAKLDNEELFQLSLAESARIKTEGWDAWEKSKQNYQREQRMRRGVPNSEGNGAGGDNSIVTTDVQERSEEIVNCGDPRYLEIVNKQLIEERKMLGLYAPEKREISGDITFATLLMNTSITDTEKTP